MATTFGSLWRGALADVPMVPALLARKWAQQVVARLADRWEWGWLRKEGTLSILTPRTLTITATRDSTTITSAALFLAADDGRQLRVSGAGPPFYTLTFVDASTLTLDRPYLGEDAVGVSATILTAYVAVPLDFGRFLVIVDPSNRRRISFWSTAEELGVIDPGRQQTSSVVKALVAYRHSTHSTTLGQLLYEVWPQPTAALRLPFLYLIRPPAYADTDLLPGVLSARADLLETGLLAKAARWPGTPDQRNPYFNLALAQQLSLDFEQQLQLLTLKDDAQYAQSWIYPWTDYSRFPLAQDDISARASDAGYWDLAGSAYSGSGFPY